MDAHTLTGGFSDPARQAAAVFRAVMEATARPGTIHTVAGAEPPAPLSVAAGAAVLTLCDPDTPIHLAGALDCPAVRAWIAFHCGAPIVSPSQCQFALGTWSALQPVDVYSIGTPDYPDRSATLIVEQETLSEQGAALTGPGIRTVHHLNLPEIAAFQTNAARFPLGFDTLFCAGDRIAALPRSTTVSEVA